jgi:hypothetical protein
MARSIVILAVAGEKGGRCQLSLPHGPLPGFGAPSLDRLTHATLMLLCRIDPRRPVLMSVGAILPIGDR